MILRRIDIPWIWAEVIPPYLRFVISPPRCPDDGHMYVWVDPVTLSFLLRIEYERQIRRELIDPEWPSEYMDRLEDSLYD